MDNSRLVKLQQRVIHELSDSNPSIKVASQQPIIYTKRGVVLSFNGIENADSEVLNRFRVKSRLVQDKANGDFQLKLSIENRQYYYSRARLLLIALFLGLCVWCARAAYVARPQPTN